MKKGDLTTKHLMLIGGMLVVAVMMWLAIASGKDTPTLASQACSQYSSFANDFTSGLLTTAQIQSRAQDIYGASDGASDPTQQAAQEMLAAANQDNGDGLLVAMGDMMSACHLNN